MRSSQPSQLSLRYSLPTLAGSWADTLSATERAFRYLCVRHRMVHDAVQSGRHDFVVFTEHGIRLFHKEVHT